MHMSNESLLVILVVGVVAGWLAGKIVQGTGFGIIGDLIIGVIGAFIGGCCCPNWAFSWAPESSRRSSPTIGGCCSCSSSDCCVAEAGGEEVGEEALRSAGAAVGRSRRFRPEVKLFGFVNVCLRVHRRGFIARTGSKRNARRLRRFFVLGVAQGVAAAPDGLDVYLTAGGCCELLSQLAYEDVDDLVFGAHPCHRRDGS